MLKRKLSPWVPISALAMAVAPTASLWAGPERDTISDCGYVYYGDYEPKEPRSLRGFPKGIRFKVVTHLRARLGDAVFARLRYTGGQVVDIDRLHKVNPDSMEYEWVVPTYLLHFTIELGSDPAERYCAEITLAADGTVLDDIALPKTADDPGRLAIVPKAKAVAVAATHDIPVERAWTQLAYAPAFDCLEWLVGYKVDEHLSSFREHVLHLDAVDPSKYRWSEQVGDY